MTEAILIRPREYSLITGIPDDLLRLWRSRGKLFLGNCAPNRMTTYDIVDVVKGTIIYRFLDVTKGEIDAALRVSAACEHRLPTALNRAAVGDTEFIRISVPLDAGSAHPFLELSIDLGEVCRFALHRAALQMMDCPPLDRIDASGRFKRFEHSEIAYRRAVSGLMAACRLRDAA